MSEISPVESHGESRVRTRLERLISESLFYPVFQPIVDIQRARIAGMEALTRVQPDSGFEHAGALFDAAERHGMLWPLEAATRRSSFEAAANWNPEVQLFLNCSPQVFAHRQFADEVHALVQNSKGLTPGRVVLEITERSEQEYIEGMSRQVNMLKERGFEIAIDDVGAGTSGLNRIMRLRPHWLKLDRDLIESIDKDRVKQNLIRFLVHFARLSGVKIIAEGVERSEELAVLMDLGIVYAQGFYLAKPGGKEIALGDGVSRWLRDRWAEVQSSRLSRASGQRIGRLAQVARVLDASIPIAGAAAEFSAWSETVNGAVVVEGHRCVGWADRDWTQLQASGENAGYPIGSLLPAGAVVVNPDDSLMDVLEQLGSRDTKSASHPVIVFESGRVLGIVPLADILSSVAEMARNPLVRTTAITGMPGRVRADEHLSTLISQAPSLTPLEQHDAALIDIRHFTDYNGAFGYELGDQLLQELANSLRTELLATEQSAFVAHLGDDRFLVTGRPGALERRLSAVVKRFEGAAVQLSASPDGAPGEGSGSSVGLRIVVLPGVTSRVADSRELFRLASRIRERGHESPDATIGRFSMVLHEAGEGAKLRLTA